MLPAARIAQLLHPFLGNTAIPAGLPAQLQTYLDLLLRWNVRINLTAVCDPEQIVTRHFGESLFAARLLRDTGLLAGTPTLSDVGSGAGFPGIPIKLLAPRLHLTLIESQNKKATFLREAVRTLNLGDVEVFCGRAGTWNRTATIVTLRAVEKFSSVLPAAAHLVAPQGNLCLLLGVGQLQSARQELGTLWEAETPVPIPLSDRRVVLVARKLRAESI
ncbi:MAG TPA: 16S rRNA (guanine(527)-N(7))-methyltransferase RsmG [Candidatus Eisenbacteria bacterium]|nr:16S rRNA (guanine(527)-N(7))-methyltransferase RsmG [Candidatus Eisenbacteria bacterium]